VIECTEAGAGSGEGLGTPRAKKQERGGAKLAKRRAGAKDRRAAASACTNSPQGKGTGANKARAWFLTSGQRSRRLGVAPRAFGSRHGGCRSSTSSGGGDCAREGLGASEIRQGREGGCAVSSKES
jgi:hypothetical protein